ncbi:MAG: exosortase system-associated protein, TIGR04073 family [Candidatus Omnitrophota bacterium]
MNLFLKCAVFAVLLIFVFTSAEAYADNAIDKLCRGLVSILSSPLELFTTIGDCMKKDGPAVGICTGLGQGIWNTGIKAAAGVYETATFLIPIPAGYKPVLKSEAQEKAFSTSSEE